MSPIHMSEELISAMPILGDQDFNSFNLDEGILQNPDQHIGDIEEMFRSMDEQRFSVFPEIEPDDFEDQTADAYDSRVADYMWNGMDVKNSASRALIKNNVVVNSSTRPRSLLRSNLNVAPVASPPPPPLMVTVTTPSLVAFSSSGSECGEDSGRPETPNSISDSDEVIPKVEAAASPMFGLDDFSATYSVWGRSFVPPESALISSYPDDDFLDCLAFPVSEVTGQIPPLLASATAVKPEDVSASPVSPITPAPSSRAASPLPPRDPAAIAVATSNLFNDHSYPMSRNGYPGIPGNLTPSDSEEEIDVVNDFKARPSRSSAAALPNNPTANDRKVLQRTVASKISPPQMPAVSPGPSPPPSPPRRTPAIMGGPSLNQMRADNNDTLVRSKRECIESITTRRRREVRAQAEDEEHVRRLRQRETGFVPQPAPAPIRKEVRVMNNGMVMPAATEPRPDWLVVCHNKRDRFRKSRARIEQDAWQNVQSVRKKHRQKQAMSVRRAPASAAMSDVDSEEDVASRRRGRGAKRKHKRDLDSEERRSQHNHMERRRRVDLRESFEELRLQIPMTDGKAAKVAILEGAAVRIRCVQNVEEQLLDEEDRLLKDYFNLRARMLRLKVSPQELEGWSDNDLVVHEVASVVEKMEAAEGVGQDDEEGVEDGEVGVDEDDDDPEEEEEEEQMVRRPAAKRRRTAQRNSDSDSGDDDDAYYCSYR